LENKVSDILKDIWVWKVHAYNIFYSYVTKVHSLDSVTNTSIQTHLTSTKRHLLK